MPRHKQVTSCLKGGGPISKLCMCEHCNLSVCKVCGAFEGSLTSDCPGKPVNFDRRKEVYETNLDYSDERGWHQGKPMKNRTPCFVSMKQPAEPPSTDPRARVAPSIDWTIVDRNANLQHALSQKAIGWVLADRICEDRAATLARVEDETTHLHGKALTADDYDLLGKLEGAKIDFKIACRRVEECDDEFRQTARKLVASLEGSCVLSDGAVTDEGDPTLSSKADDAR